MELDIQLNASDRNTRETISKNFQRIQDEDTKDDGAFQKFQNDANKRMDHLDEEKATHDDVNNLRDEIYKIRDNWHDRASHIARGTDVETTKTVVEQILQEKGLI